MIELNVEARFLYAVDRKIYDKGDKITVADKAEADYFIKHKLASYPKTEKEPTKEKTVKAKK